MHSEAHPLPAPAGPLWRYRLIHHPSSHGYATCHNFLGLMISVATFNSTLETVAPLSAKYSGVFHFREILITTIFTVEYLSHLITTRRKLSYVFSFWGRVDLVAIVPTFFQVTNVPALKSARMLRALRVMRVLKLAREAITKMKTDARDDMRRSLLRRDLVIYRKQGQGWAKQLPGRPKRMPDRANQTAGRPITLKRKIGVLSGCL